MDFARTPFEDPSTRASTRRVKAVKNGLILAAAATSAWLACASHSADAQATATFGHRQPLARDEVGDDTTERAFTVLSAQTGLAKLGFFARPFTVALDDRTRDALGAFQQRVGLEVTYALDKATRERLDAIERALEWRPTTPGYSYFEFPSAARRCEGRDERSPDCVAVQAQGTWLHPDMAGQMTTNLIECDVGLGSCRDTQAQIRTIMGRHMSVETQDYEIE